MSKAKNRAHKHLRNSQGNNAAANAPVPPVQAIPEASESPEQRVRRLHSASGGSLMGWLLDEARIRGMALNVMATELGVTYGYINQLRSGLRSVAQVSPRFIQNAARFLGVPAVVVKLMAGHLSVSDFMPPGQTEEEFVERAFNKVLLDPKASMFVSFELLVAHIDVKKDFLAMYAEVTGDDIFNWHELPEILQWLRLATVAHAANAANAQSSANGQHLSLNAA